MNSNGLRAAAVSVLAMATGCSGSSSGGNTGTPSGNESGSHSGSSATGTDGGGNDGGNSAISGSSSGSGASAGSSSGSSAGTTSCTITENSSLYICYSNVPSSLSPGYCHASSGGETITPVAACPTANVVGTCTFTVAASTPYSFDATYYSNPGQDCATIKQTCAGAAVGAITTSFAGGC